jgi:CheY-like chemotaxis protein/two-component sensor histidine kinase
LRNPLAPIRTGLDLLGLNAKSRSTDDNKIIHMMNAQVDHLVRLVDELLDVSRIMRGRIELKKEPLDLAQVIYQAVETVRSLIQSQQHDLTLSLPETTIFLNADPVRLTQVISNLLHNAAKYTPSGGQIRLSADREGKTAVIRVWDNGIGIESSLLPWVFDLFSQSQRSIDRAQGGLGIGLTVARSLVEMHQGTLTVHSEGEGKGSEFAIRLPLGAAAAEMPAIQQPPAEATSYGGCILIVDDNPDIVQTQQLLFSSLGPFQIHTAQDGPTALKIAKAHQPHLILLDIGLPGMSGYEVVRQLRSDPQFQHALLVALSGYGQPEDQRRSKEAGFDEHLVKPVSLETLLTLLNHPKLKHSISLASLSRPLQEGPDSVPPLQ